MMSSNSTALPPLSFEHVRLIDRFNPRQQLIGTIFCTSTHFIFIDSEGKRETWILNSLISSFENLPTIQHGCPVRIRTKHFFCAEFIIPKERDATDLYNRLTSIKPDSSDEIYCFLYRGPKHLEKVWDPFSLEKEFTRMGVPNHEWRVEKMNENFDVCPTYPPILYVPSSSTKSMLLASAKFRSRARLPVLTYLHHNGASITRCAQPLVGFNSRCLEDEQLLELILKTNLRSNSMYIIDTRPRINAVANRAAGKGYENEVYYANIQFKFCPIENIHVMRESLQKLLDAFEMKNSSMSQYLTALHNSSWLQHIRAVLDAASFIARAIHSEEKNVLVHCSDGWDRTAQCCSLATLLLSPYFRSIHGFRMLVEKEWLAFGHKFSDRCGHLKNSDPKEQSPVFLQFIEVVWQLSEIYPTAFEFNERFLIALHDNIHACQFGNFVGNCFRERIELSIKEKTYSFWHYVLQNVNDYQNPLFRPQSTYASEVLLPTINSQTLKVWLNMYQRFDRSILPKENLLNTLIRSADHIEALRDHSRLLEKRIRELRQIDASSLTTSSMVDSSRNENEPISNSSIDLRTRDRISFELNSIALDWRSYRANVHCACASPFDSMERKFNCWRCGENFCNRCIDRAMHLPGLYHRNLVPVCKTCAREIKSSST